MPKELAPTDLKSYSGLQPKVIFLQPQFYTDVHLFAYKQEEVPSLARFTSTSTIPALAIIVTASRNLLLGREGYVEAAESIIYH